VTDARASWLKKLAPGRRASDHLGNNDGGSGAQVGLVDTLMFQSISENSGGKTNNYSSR